MGLGEKRGGKSQKGPLQDGANHALSPPRLKLLELVPVVIVSRLEALELWPIKIVPWHELFGLVVVLLSVLIFMVLLFVVFLLMMLMLPMLLMLFFGLVVLLLLLMMFLLMVLIVMNMVLLLIIRTNTGGPASTLCTKLHRIKQLSLTFRQSHSIGCQCVTHWGGHYGGGKSSGSEKG